MQERTGVPLSNAAAAAAAAGNDGTDADWSSQSQPSRYQRAAGTDLVRYS